MRGKTRGLEEGKQAPEPKKTFIERYFRDVKKPHMMVYWAIVLLVGIVMVFPEQSRPLAPFVIGFSMARMAVHSNEK